MKFLILIILLIGTAIAGKIEYESVGRSDVCEMCYSLTSALQQTVDEKSVSLDVS